MTSVVEDLSIYLFAICISCLVRCLLKLLAQFLVGVSGKKNEKSFSFTLTLAILLL